MFRILSNNPQCRIINITYKKQELTFWGITKVFVVFEKKLFKTSAILLSLDRIFSFSTEIIFLFVILLLESTGLRVFQNFLLPVMLFSLTLLNSFAMLFLIMIHKSFFA